MMKEYLLDFIQSFLEVVFILSILKTVNPNARLGIIKAIVYAAILAGVATAVDAAHLSYHFVFSIIAILSFYILLKRPSRKHIGNYIVDLLISIVVFSIIQLLITWFAGLLSIDLIDDSVAIIVILAILIALFERLSHIVSIHAFLDKYYMPNRVMILLAIISALFLITIVFDMILYSGELFSAAIGQNIILVVVGYFVCSLILGISLIRINRISKENTAVLEYGEQVQNVVNEYRKSSHDFNHHIQMIMNLNENPDGSAKNQKLHDYIEAMKSEKKYLGDTSIIKDDVLVSAMLHQKKEYAKQNEINFTVRILSPLSEYKLPSIELIDLLVNLIDNAFEAVESLVTEDRCVYLDFDDGQIVVRNKTISGTGKVSTIKPNRFFEDGYSTKGTDRGFGLSNVLSIAKSFNIQVENDIENDFVIFRLVFKND